MAKANYAQTQLVTRLALTAGFQSLDDAVATAGFRGTLDSNEASAMIDRLKAGTLKPVAKETTTAPEGGITLEQAFSMLGKRVEITACGVRKDGSMGDVATFTIDVTTIGLSDLTGLPIISGTRVDNLSPISRHFHLIQSWTI